MNQKGFAGIFVLVLALVIAVAGGAYYLGRVSTKPQLTKTQQPAQITQTIPSPTISPTPDPTANWKTYINNEYKYSVLYPDFVTFKALGSGNVIFYYKKDELKSRPDVELPAYYTNGLHFYFRSDPATEAPKHELPGRPVQEVKINNAKGVKIADSDLDYYLSSEIRDNSIRVIYLSLKAYQTEEEIGERLKIYNQILSTFRFTQ